MASDNEKLMTRRARPLAQRYKRGKAIERAPERANIKDCSHNHLYRVVSRPNGLWRAERRVAEHGMNKVVARLYGKIEQKAEPHADCWEGIGPDTDKVSASETRDNWARRNGPPGNPVKA